jgi:hypothetical protein
MPIRYSIDRAQHLVIATLHGVLTDADIFGYQQAAWSGPETQGFDELVDMTEVAMVEFVSVERMAELATLSGSTDAPSAASKLAIVAVRDYHYGLGRMYQAYREMAKQSTKVVQVFRDRASALAWLGARDNPAAESKE